jgi:hypothetical protein
MSSRFPVVIYLEREPAAADSSEIGVKILERPAGVTVRGAVGKEAYHG